MAEEFTPQFLNAAIKGTYQRVPVIGGKAYIGKVQLTSRFAKHLKGWIFKTATEAENYSKKVVDQYARLVRAKINSMLEVPA